MRRGSAPESLAQQLHRYPRSGCRHRPASLRRAGSHGRDPRCSDRGRCEEAARLAGVDAAPYSIVRPSHLFRHGRASTPRVDHHQDRASRRQPPPHREPSGSGVAPPLAHEPTQHVLARELALWPTLRAEPRHMRYGQAGRPPRDARHCCRDSSAMRSGWLRGARYQTHERHGCRRCNTARLRHADQRLPPSTPPVDRVHP